MWWLGQGQNAAAVQAAAAVVQGVLTLFALFITVYLPQRQRADEKKLDDIRVANELQHLRIALREEVFQIATQTLLAYDFWIKDQVESARSLSLPTPFVVVSNAAQIGRLNREEIVPLIGFAGYIADIRTFAENLESNIASEPFQLGEKQISKDAKLSGAGLLRSICSNAAQFLKVTPAPLQEDLMDRYKNVIERLSKAGQSADADPVS